MSQFEGKKDRRRSGEGTKAAAADSRPKVMHPRSGLPLFLKRRDTPGVMLKGTIRGNDESYEQQADAVAAKVQRMAEPDEEEIIDAGNDEMAAVQARSDSSGPPRVTRAVREAIRSPGQGTSVEPAIRSRAESALGVDLGSVRVHRGRQAQKAARSIKARAFTHRNDIWLGKGQSPGDTALMAHELTHVVQQGAGGGLVQASLLDDAMALQGKAYNLTHKGFDQVFPPPRPTRGRKLRKWKQRPDVRNYMKASKLAMKIVALVPKAGSDQSLHHDIEARAQMVASDLARAAFADEAMAIADKLGANIPEQIKNDPKKSARFIKKDDELKGFIYKPLIGKAADVDVKHLKKITAFYTKAHNDPATHPVLKALTAGKCELAGQIKWDKVKSILNAAIDGYQGNTKLVDPVTKLLIFQPHFRQRFAQWMWKKKKTFLFSVLSAKEFVEPGYDATKYEHQKALTLKKDFPWVYTWKQKYYVGYLIDLCKQAQTKDPAINVPPDPRLSEKPGTAVKGRNFRKVKAWLSKHTDTIGAALAVLYPQHPDKIRDVYHKIGDIFFHHVDQGHVKADRFGKIAGLGSGTPGMRIKADCDVLAAYAARLMRHAGFTVMGYLLILSCDPKRSHHASALLKKGARFYAVSNKNTYDLNAADLPDAKKKLHPTTLDDAYYKPYPKHYTQYHSAGPQGELPANYLPRPGAVKSTCRLQNP